MLDNTNEPDKKPISKRVLLKVQSSIMPTGNILIYDELRTVHIEMYKDEHEEELKNMYKKFPPLRVRGTKMYVMATIYPELHQIDLDDTSLLKSLWPDW